MSERLKKSKVPPPAHPYNRREPLPESTSRGIVRPICLAALKIDDELNPDLLFNAVSETLLDVAQTQLGGILRFTTVLSLTG